MAAVRKYPWEAWLGRQRTVLVHGVHYRCSQSTMVQMARNAASRLGVRVRVLDTGDAVVIEVAGVARGVDEGVGGGEVLRTDPAPVPG